MRIVHISDTHGQHSQVNVPECDVLVHTGDIGGRTTLGELAVFLRWFEKQPAKLKIFIAGNHDIVLDYDYMLRKAWISSKQYYDAKALIDLHDVAYLYNQAYVYEGCRFYGTPYSPSFHKEFWAFNADRGEEIMEQWAKIPDDVNVLLTHTPPYKIFDNVPERLMHHNEEENVGCKDLLGVVKGLKRLKLHCFGHIHSNYGQVFQSGVMFSNGSVLTHEYEFEIPNPVLINIPIRAKHDTAANKG